MKTVTIAVSALLASFVVVMASGSSARASADDATRLSNHDAGHVGPSNNHDAGHPGPANDHDHDGGH